MGERKTTPMFLSVLSSLFSNVTFAGCFHSTEQRANSRTQPAHKEQSQMGRCTSAPTKQCWEIMQKSTQKLCENQAFACGIHGKKKTA